MWRVIDVTEEDIAKGIKGNADACPVALALSRSFKIPMFVYEHYGAIDGNDFGTTPYEVFRKIVDYDNDEGMQPFTFLLES